MKLRYPMTCLCGARCDAGTNVHRQMFDEGYYPVVACPSCDVSLSRVADVGVDRIDPGITLAERMRRNAAKRRRK